MTLFITSSPTGCPYEPGPQPGRLDENNGFVERLRAVWPATPPKGLMIASDPHSYERTDEACDFFAGCFARAGLPLDGMTACDARNADEIAALLAHSGFVMLAGGHVPTQNRFFKQLNLARRMQGYDGIVMGVSAGSMNCARTVYAQPEEAGEAVDPKFERWLPGLGLTETCILPHYQFIRGVQVDGQTCEALALADSHTRPIYALADGSYILCANGRETLYGEAWRFALGSLSERQPPAKLVE